MFYLNKLKCKVTISSKKSAGHISQIVTGFMMLKEKGKIDLDVEISNELPHPSIIFVNINNEKLLVYDMMDGYLLTKEQMEQYLKKVDFYFKRSFSKTHNNQYKNSYKIMPLGFNYHVTIKNNIIDKPYKATKKENLKWFIKETLGKNYHQNFYIEAFESIPEIINKKPLILFNTRLWIPSGEELETQISGQLKEEREFINEIRVQCIRNLRNEFGNNFIGGLVPTEYAKKYFSDCLLDKSMIERVSFLNLVKKADICIATMGLHQSNGWKLGEYVAASKAIVSEKLRYDVPNFKIDKNYLEFNNVDECIRQVKKLVENKDLILQMKINNHSYYNNYLRPDMLILKSLLVATEDDQIQVI